MFNTQNAYFQVHYQGSASQGRQGIPLHTPGGYAASGFIPDNSSSLMQDESTPREAHVMLSRRLADKQVMHIAEPTFPAYSNPQFRPVRHFQTVHDDDIQGTSNSASVMLTPSVSGHNRPVFNVPLPDYDPEFKIGVTVHGRPGKRLWSTRLHEGKSNAVNDTIKSTVDKHDKVLDKLFEDTYICTQTVPFATGTAGVIPWRSKRDPAKNYTLGHLLTSLSRKQHGLWRRMSGDAQRPEGEQDKRLLKDLVGPNAGLMGEEVVHLDQVYIVAIRRRWVSRPAWQTWCYFLELQVRLG